MIETLATSKLNIELGTLQLEQIRLELEKLELQQKGGDEIELIKLKIKITEQRTKVIKKQTEIVRIKTKLIFPSLILKVVMLAFLIYLVINFIN